MPGDSRASSQVLLQVPDPGAHPSGTEAGELRKGKAGLEQGSRQAGVEGAVDGNISEPQFATHLQLTVLQLAPFLLACSPLPVVAVVTR